MSILDKLTSRNALAIGTASVFLYSVLFTLWNLDKISQLVGEDPTSAGIAGLIVGAFLMVTKDIYQFFFRTSGPTS